MLTAKQENFIELLSQGTSQASAYRGAYETQKMYDKTVWEEAPQGSGNTPRSVQGF